MATGVKLQPKPALFTEFDLSNLSSDVFGQIGIEDEKCDPIWFFKYFLAEARGAEPQDKARIVKAFNLLFKKLPGKQSGTFKYEKDGKQTTGEWSRPFTIQLKDGLQPVRAQDVYTFANGNGADIWREALTELLLAGFHWQPCDRNDQVTESLKNAQLEKKFVYEVGGPENANKIEVFWRCDGRKKQDFIDIDAAVAAVDTAQSADRSNLRQKWHPYSNPDIKNKLWLRRSSKDNDYYTIVSVGLDFRTVTAFPTLDETKAYTWPMDASGYAMKPITGWDEAEFNKQRKYLAKVSVSEAGKPAKTCLRICTKVFAYMAVITKGFVIHTQNYGAGKASESFPERGIRGFSKDLCVAYLPLLRVHHGPKREDGFTLFVDPRDPPRLLITPEEMQNRYGTAKDRVMKLFDDALNDAQKKHLRSAWAANGFQDPKSDVVIHRIEELPPASLGAKADLDRLKQ
jgi:hypothetical protein